MPPTEPAGPTARTAARVTPPVRRTTAAERLQRWAASPVAQFAVSGLVALAVVGLLAVHLVQRTTRTEALGDAKDLTRVAGRIVAPALTPGVLRGDPRALADLDRVVRRDVLRAPVVRVKVWAPDGRILYADESRLIGARYELGAQERAALRRGGVEADTSDLSKP
jgi:two-component system NarL family sensor kinase